MCISDEHYYPTVLAALGLGNETSCKGYTAVYTDWSNVRCHPSGPCSVGHIEPTASGPRLRSLETYSCAAGIH